MKRLFKRGLAMAFCLLYIALGQVQAFDFMADVDEVSRDPLTAYTLYVGMPWNDFLENYSNISGWTFYKNKNSYARIFFKNESLNSNIREFVLARKYPDGLLRTKENDVSGYGVFFMTNSLDIAERIFNRLSSNIEYNLGKEEQFASRESIIYEHLVKSKYWSSNGKTIKIQGVYGYGNKSYSYDSHGLKYMTKYVVSIERYIIKT